MSSYSLPNPDGAFRNGSSLNGAARHNHAPYSASPDHDNALATQTNGTHGMSGPNAATPPLSLVVGARSAPEDEGGLDLRALLSMLLRRRKPLLLTFLAIFGSGMTWTLLQHPIYESSAKVLLNLNKSKGQSGGVDLPVLGDIMDAASTRSIETQVEVLKSAPVQTSARGRLSAEHRDALARYTDMTVEPVRSTDVVALSVRSQSSDAARAYADALCAEYIAHSKSENSEQVRAATNYVRDQLRDVRDRLDKSQTALKNYQKAAGTADLPSETQAQIGGLATLEATLRTARTERDAAKGKLDSLKSQIAKLAPQQTRPGPSAIKPEVQQLKAQIQLLETERANTALTFRANSVEMRDINGRLSEMRAQLNAQKQFEVGSFATTPNESYQALAAQIASTQAEVGAGEARARELALQLQSVRAKMSQLPERSYRLSKLAAEVGVQQQTAQMLNEKYQTLRISQEADVPSASVLSPAARSNLIAPHRVRNGIMFLMLGALLGVGVAALLDRMDDRVHTDDEVEAATGLPALAHVPLIKESEKRTLIGNSGRSSGLLEAYRMLRANIAFSALDEPLRSLMVTSSQPGEGKSSAAANLAITMAMAGKRVILMDADLRLPTVHRQMNLGNRVGFSSVVAGQATLQDALQDTSVKNLRALTSGPLPPNPPELLDSRAARVCVQQIINECDFLIVDAPPGLALVDAQIVASLVDGALLVVSCEEASRGAVARVSALLAQTGTKVLGTIVNKIPTGLDGYYGSYGYGAMGYYGAGGRYARYLEASDHDDSNGENDHAAMNGHAASHQAGEPAQTALAERQA